MPVNIIIALKSKHEHNTNMFCANSTIEPATKDCSFDTLFQCVQAMHLNTWLNTEVHVCRYII